MSRIDREALAARHRIQLSAPAPDHVLSVGNGDFAYTADITGMQTFTAFHAPGKTVDGRSAVNTATMSNWGWHDMPNPNDYTLDDAMTTYDTARGPVRYADKHDMMGAMTGNIAEEYRAGAWLNANPQRVDLGRIGLALWPSPDADAEADPSVLTHTAQALDLWTGTIESTFSYLETEVHVETVAAPDGSVVAFRIKSDLLSDGRAQIRFQFPYASDGFFQTDDWEAAQKHTSSLVGSRIRRVVDALEYDVDIRTSSGSLVAADQPHEFFVTGVERHVELVVRFVAGDPVDVPTFAEVAAESESSWIEFWSTGAVLDLSGSGDPRAHELERRIVLSQYLTRVHGSGSLPPAETGLVTNSWQGKFHLEMHLWHAAHFAVWGRPELLERSLSWYLSVLDDARDAARVQGYPGARWPKQTGPDGRESPSDIGSLLVWQQPHLLHMLELVYQASDAAHRHDLLTAFQFAVHETATFMAAFVEERGGAFHLGPPIMPAQEFYDARTTTDPTFELAYWWWGLDIAQQWRERLGQQRDEGWADVQERLASPGGADGRYLAVATAEPMRRDDHPSLLMALGVVPETPLVDPEVMKATLENVWHDWEWPTAWGWDFPVMAMTAARLGLRALAVDALLRDEQKNQYTAVGHNPQMPGILPLYLPGNGSLLLAVALMAQSGGFDIPGWTARAEGFSTFPLGTPFDPARPPQVIDSAPAVDAADVPATDEPLTADTPIGVWLEHPTGGDILRGFLLQVGTSAESIGSLKGLPLQQLVALSQGKMPQDAVDGLVRAANGSQ